MADEVDPASMIAAPHLKPRLESETKKVGGPGDPRGGVAAIHNDTPADGTETPWRNTPPTNVSSAHAASNDQSPPTDPAAKQEDCNAKPRDAQPSR